MAAGLLIDLGDLRIRSWRADDLEALALHANNRAIWRNLRDLFPHPYTREAARTWLALAADQDPETDFALAAGGEGLPSAGEGPAAAPNEAIGAIGLRLGEDVFRRSAEIGYWLAEPYWGRGLATRAVAAFTDWALARFALARLWAGVFEWSPASARVLEKAGYELEARLRKSVEKDGRLIDQLVFARLREADDR